MEVVLTIAGSDSSGGAGIQQDLKTITAHGCYGATVITSVTAQNTLGVQHAMTVPPQVVAQQLQAVLSDLAPRAIKIGMIPDQAVAEVIVSELQAYLQQHPDVAVVYDPVMVSTSGYQLMAPEAIDYVAEALFPLCTLVTPNLPELQLLAERGYIPACRLVKGGHAQTAQMTDYLYMADGSVHQFTTEKITSTNLHGTGCTLSSAIAANLALGADLPTAVARAKDYITQLIKRSAHLQIGHGNGPLV